nr:alanine racemase [Lachnospiraceae bacterium]
MIKDLKLRAYAEINLDDLIFNLKKINEGLKPGTAMCCVVKADAYGHGAVQVSKAVSELDFVKFLAVATPEEGGEIRENGVDLPILILSPSFPDSLETVINNDLRPSVFTERQLSALSDMAVIAGKTVKIHVPVDTGMSRIGVRPDEEGLLFIKKAANTPGISLEGVFTHLSRADETDPLFSRDRAGVFMEFCGKIKASGVDVPICHCSNSAGIMTIPEANMDMVRVGITMYGLSPSSEVTREMAGLKSVMRFHSSVSYIKEIPAGTPVSYGGTYVSDKVMRIATVAAGYADGYPRLLSNKGCVLI